MAAHSEQVPLQTMTAGQYSAPLWQAKLLEKVTALSVKL